ncbi:MAG: hypothetical protein L3K06_05820, partial [Thermoplasmata archaeon]|nr:hypothetical protein [Thermoplasmata archaeon]
PASRIPSAYQWVAFLAPSTYAGQLADAAVGLSYGSLTPGFLNSPIFDLVGLVAITIACGLAAAFLARWREP